MEYRRLGRSCIEVSLLSYGTLTLSALQCGMSDAEGTALLCHAAECGVNFFDTSEYYDNYPMLRGLLRSFPESVICSKSYAWDRQTAETALTKCFRETGRDYVDVFMLHEQESIRTLGGHREALEYYLKQRDAGHIGAVGISTHRVAAVRAASLIHEIDIIMPLLNVRGLGIADGTREQMEKACVKCAREGKGIYLMKALGGGHLIGSRGEALQYALGLPWVSSITVGMQSVEEIDANVAVFEGGCEPSELTAILDRKQRVVSVQEYCRGCGECVRRCGQGAIRLVDGVATVDMDKCVLCGYCGAVCPEFALKVL